MNATVCIVTLIAGGGLLQVIGVLLVLVGIRSDRALAAEALGSLLEAEPKPTYPSDFTEHDIAIYELRHQLIKQTVRPTRAEARNQLESYDDSVRRFIRTQLTGDIGARAWGVALIVLGLTLATIGGVWATVASGL